MTALSWSGTAGAALFVIVFTVDGWTRAAYRPLYHPVSALSLGPRGRIQVGNFVVSGALITVGGVGAGSAASSVAGIAGSAVIGLVGLALIASGVWSMDPMHGYPPDATTPSPPSRGHVLHDYAGAVVFLGMPLAPFIWAWTFWQDSQVALASYSIVTGIVAAVTSGWFGVAWEKNHSRTGLIQRSMLIVVCAWIAIVCGHFALPQ